MIKNKYKKVISIDLDGVLNTYGGYKDYRENIICPIKPGAYDFLKKLHETYSIEIFTVRNESLVNSWLKENKLNNFVDKVTDKKNPFSSVIVDDRAINFDGNFAVVFDKIMNFHPHWDKKK